MVEALHPTSIEFALKKEPERKGKLAWVLSPGFFNGWLQMGAMERLEELGLSPDLVVGSSIGTYVGIIPATKLTKEKLRKMAEDYDIRVAKGKGFMNRGFFSSKRGMELIERNFPGLTFEDLPVPFYMVLTRLRDYQPVVVSEGPVLRAMEAGVAHPLFFPPVRVDGVDYYMDGGITNPAPIDVAKEKGATHVIFIDAQTALLKPSRKPVAELPKAVRLLLRVLPDGEGWINPYTVAKALFIGKATLEESQLMFFSLLNQLIKRSVELYKPDIYINFSDCLNGDRVPITRDSAHPENGMRYMELGRKAVDMYAEQLQELKEKLDGQTPQSMTSGKSAL